MKWGMAAAFVAACLVFGIGVHEPNTSRQAVIALAALALLIAANRKTWTVGPVGLTLFSCLGVYGLGLLWSSDWREGFNALVLMLPFVVIFLVLSRADGWAERVPVLTGVSVVGAFALWHWLPEIEGGFGNPNFVAEFFLIALPLVMGGLTRKTGVVVRVFLAAAVGIGVWFLVFDSTSKAKYFALIPVVAVAIYRLRGHTWGLAGVIAATIAGGLAAWSWKGQAIASSVLARAELVINTGALWLQSPMFGNGSGSFNHDYSKVQETHLSFLTNYSVLGDITTFAGTAHNEVVQTLAEHGIVGLVAVGLLLVALLRHWLSKKREPIDNWAMASLGMALWLSLIGFPLHNAHTGLLAVVAAAIVARGERAWLATSGANPIPAYLGVGTGLALVVATGLIYAGQFKLTETRIAINNAPLMAFKANVAAYDYWPFDQLTRRQLILSLTKLTTHYGDRVELHPGAADRAYRISASASPYSPATQVARLEYLMYSGRLNQEEAERILSSLKITASRHPLTWLADALYAAGMGDTSRVHASLETMTTRTAVSDVHGRFAERVLTLLKENTK